MNRNTGLMVMAGLIAAVAALGAGFVRAQDGGFAWQDEPGKQLDLRYNGRAVARYVYEFDPDDYEATYKPFLHVYSPDGTRLITKGPGGQYTHHRGIYIGYRATRYAGKSVDFWHCPKGHQEHQEFAAQVAETDLAAMQATVHWLDEDGTLVVEEEREVTVYPPGEKTMLLDVVSRLKTPQEEVVLGGDVHHSGVQFRADNEVTNRQNETSYTFPKDEYANHGPEVNLDWAAMTFALGDERYTVAQLNHPANPEETEWSTHHRKYGRFGAYPKATLKGGETLTLRYGFWIVQGDPPTREQIQEQYEAFINRSPGEEAPPERGG